MEFRQLTIKDLDAYKSIRLALLEDSPENFGSSYDEESKFDLSVWVNRLSKQSIKVVGAFDDDLVGLLVIALNPRIKMKHIAHIHSMYVRPSHRQMGIAKNLIEEAFSICRNHLVSRVNLSVVTTNKNAFELYKKMGFTVYGEEPDAIQYNQKFYHLYLMTKEL